MTKVRFSIDTQEKVGVIGRNGVGKTTLFNILSGTDNDYSGEIIFKRGAVVVSTTQEHLNLGDTTVLQYILKGLPEYTHLSEIIETYPSVMEDDIKMIEDYTQALNRFNDKGFFQIEEQIERELENFQLPDVAHRPLSSLSGGERRLIEVVKVMHSNADLALIDEPTNHMDYIAKAQYIEWMKWSPEAMLVITHDRDVLNEVDRIIELKDSGCVSYKGNYDSYLKQNAIKTTTQVNDFAIVEKRISNLKKKIIDYRRLKEMARNPLTVQNFKRLEENAKKELEELQAKERPSFWIDKESVSDLNYKAASQYDKFKARNIRMNLKNELSRSKHIIVSARDLALGYDDQPLFAGINFDLHEGEALEIRGRNGAGKTTLLKAILGESRDEIMKFEGEVTLDPNVRVGIYEQEVSPTYFNLSLHDAIEKMYLDKDLSISETKIRALMNDYLFTEADGKIEIAKLSGGQKARFQLISMLANDPQLLILDEPTNHLDLPSIEELETALMKYQGAMIFVSHDGYFRKAISGEVLEIS